MKCTSTAPTEWGDRPFIEFLCEVDRLLHERYGITADDLDAVAAAQEAGDSPEEHVAWLAEHYDLCPLPGTQKRGEAIC